MTRNFSGLPAAAAALALLPAAAGRTDPLPSPAVIRIGAAYVAKQYCSCLFVAARSETSCRAEFKPQIDMAQVAVDRAGMPERAKVAVTMPGVIAEASYSRRYGCVLVK